MDFSKLETEVINYDIKHLIEDLLFSLKAQSRFKRVVFSVDLGNNLPNIQIDVGQIQQVLMNLLNNAADALEQRAKQEETQGVTGFIPRIGIQASYDEARAVLKACISDNGCGIPEDSLPKVFQPHFTTKETGHGLGLANCRKIVKNHSGEITLTSKANEGTTFTIFLPKDQVDKIK
jgi:signal transduction histidine kinase